MLIHYANAQDEFMANLVKKRLVEIDNIPSRIAPLFLDINNVREDIAVIGGQVANPVFAQYVRAGVIRNIAADEQLIQVGAHNAHAVYAIAGWTRSDTLSAVSRVFLNGLPNNNEAVNIPAANLYLLTIGFKPSLQPLAPTIGRLMQRVINVLPLGWEIDYWDFNENTRELEILLRETGSLLLTGVLAIILGTLVIVGILSFKWDDINNSQANILMAHNDADVIALHERGELSDEAFNGYFDAREQIAKAQEEAAKGVDVGKALNAIMGVALAGFGLYVGVKFGLPILEELSEKRKAKKVQSAS